MKITPPATTPPMLPHAVPKALPRDIKPPVSIPSGWEWLWWTLGAIAVVVLLVWAWRRWKKGRRETPAVPPVPPHVVAKQRLQEALALIGQPREFCILVSDTVRWYLEERFDFRAPERTTEEFLYELQATELLTPDQKGSLGEFLQRCDLVKFARYEPAEAELRELHSSALRLVEETEPPPVSVEPPTVGAAMRLGSAESASPAAGPDSNSGGPEERTLETGGTGEGTTRAIGVPERGAESSESEKEPAERGSGGV